MNRATTQLRLRACGAARTFARGRMARRETKRRSIPWMPVVLRWRRAIASAARLPRPLRLAGHRVERAPWHVRMHLRLEGGTAATRDTRPLPCAQSVSVPALHAPARIRHESRQIVAWTIAGHAAVTTLRDKARASVMRPNLLVAPTMMAMRIATRHPPSMDTMHPAPRGSSSPRSQEELAYFARDTSRRVPLRFHASRIAASNARPSSGRASSAVEALSTRSPDLVWRTRDPAATAGDPAQTLATGAHLGPAETARPKVSFEIANLQAPHAAQRNQPLDATFVNRVADDVIRRIDRQLRIERERRGL